MSVRVGVNITANNADLLRGVVSSKAALRSLKDEQRQFSVSTRIAARESRDLNRALLNQRRALQGLTLDYVSVRRTLLTLGVRGAVTGLASLTSGLNSAAASAGLLAGSLGNLASAGIIGGTASVLALGQAFTVASLAMDGLGKAITSKGKAHETAINKLTKPAREFVVEIRSLRDEYRTLQLTTQEGLFPGLVEGVREVEKLFPIFNQAAYDTATTLGYLGERAGEMAGRRGPELERFLQRNIITMRRLGTAAENFGAGFLDVFVAAEPLIGHMTRGIVTFSDKFKDKMKEWREDGSLSDVFGNLRESWDNWMSTFGSVGKMAFEWWDAVQPVIHKVEEAISDAFKSAAEWTAANKEGIRKYFDDALDPMSSFLKLIGRLGETFVKFSQAGNDDLIRFFDGFRTKVIPLLENLFLYFDQKLFPKILDVGSALVDFSKSAMPGIKSLLSVLGPIADLFIKILDLGGDLIDFGQGLGSVGGAIATLLVGGTIISSWKIFRRELALTGVALARFSGLSSAPSPFKEMRRTAGGFLPLAIARGAVTAPGAMHRYQRDHLLERVESRIPTTDMRVASNRVNALNNTRFFAPGSSSIYSTPQRVPGITKGDPLGRTLFRPGNLNTVAGNPLFTKGSRSNPIVVTLSDTSPRSAPMRPGVSSKRGIGGRDVPPTTKGSPLRGQGGAAGAGLLGLFGGPLGVALLFAPFVIPAAIKLLKPKKKPKLVTESADLAREFQRIQGGARGGLGGNTSVISKRMANFSDPLEKAIKEKNINALHKLAGGIDSVGNATKDLDKRNKIKEFAKDVHAVAAKTEQDGIDKLAASFEGLDAPAADSLNHIMDRLAVFQNEIGNKTGRKGRVFKQAMANSFGQAANEIQKGMDAGVISVKKGMAAMERLLTKQFKVLGFTKEQAKHLAQTGDLAGKTESGSSGNVQGNAVGGFYLGNKGDRGRDNVPMNVNGQPVVAAKGEYVGIFNATQQKAFDSMAAQTGHGSMESFFRGTSRPHYMAGGGIIKLGRQLEQQGFDVGENPAFGGVHPVHVKGSLHYSGNALDINADSMRGGEKQNLDRLAARLTGQGWHVLWQVANHFDHLHVDTANGQGGGGGLKAPKLPGIKIGGPASLLKGLAGGENARFRQGAQSVLDAGFAASLGDTGSFQDGKHGALSRAQIAGLMRKSGFPNSEIATGVAVALAESGGDPDITNSIGATGLWQILLSAHPTVSAREAKDPNFATRYAHKLWQQSGWQPWEAYTGPDGRGADGPYLQYLMGNKRIGAALGYASAAIPDRNHGVPTVNPNDVNAPQVGGPKPKKPKKKKPHKVAKSPPYSPAGGPHPKSKKPKKKKPRKKVKKLIESPFTHDDLTLKNTVDPITGENQDVTKAFSPFKKTKEMQKWIDTMQNERLPTLEGLHALPPEEIPIVTLYNSKEFGDLDAFLKNTLGVKDLEKWKTDNGDELDVVNANGMNVQGRWTPGVGQAVGELNQLIDIHSAAPAAFGLPGGILGGMQWQKVWAGSVDTKGAIKEYNKRIRKVKRFFLANVHLRRTLRKKMHATKKNNYTRGEAYDHNKKLISAYQRAKRDSIGLTKNEKADFDHKIDELRDNNDRLNNGRNWRRKRLKTDPLYERHLSEYQRRGAENRLLMGDKDATEWPPSAQPKGSGAGGLYLFMRSAWQEADDFRTDTLTGLRGSIPTERLNIASLLKSKEEWTGTRVDPKKIEKPDTSQADADKERLDELKKNKLIEGLTAALLGSTQFGVLKSFASLVGQRYIGAFAHGGLVGETGMALVHKGERINPDPDGPFRTGMNSSSNTQPTVYVDLVLRDRAGQLVELVDQRVRMVAPGAVSRSVGQRTRVLRASGGR